MRCGKLLRFDRRHRRNRKYCRRCAKETKRERDRGHKQRYRETGLGKEQRKRESRGRRARLGWTEYMQFWRKADPRRRAKQERERARRYYAKHRAAIADKRRRQRAAQKNVRSVRSH